MTHNSIKNNPHDVLWDHLANARFVMLGSPDPRHHMQPMSPNPDTDAETIWFYADASSDLVEAVRQSDATDMVHMCATEKSFQACLRGTLTEYKDAAKIEQYWSPVVEAWFKKGQQDPDLTMLCFTPHHAALWQSDANPITFAYEIAKGVISEAKPDIGERASVSF